MLKLLLKFSALALSICYVTATGNCHALQQSQLASLNERMNQMINTLYSSPFLSSITKSKSNSQPSYASSSPPPSEYPPPPPPYDPYYQSYQQSTTSPHVVYMSSSGPSGSPPSVSITTTSQPCPYHSAEPETYQKPAAYPSSYYDYYYNQSPGCASPSKPAAPSYPAPTATVSRTYEYSYPSKPYEYTFQYPEAPEATSQYYQPLPPCTQIPPAYPPPSYPTPSPSYPPPPPPPYSPSAYPPAQSTPAFPGYGSPAATSYGAYPTRAEFVNPPSPYSY